MAKYFLFFCLALAAVNLPSKAGKDDDASQPPRKEFRQQAQYPYIFQPVAYLSNQGPVPLRFGVPADDGSRHNPPALPTPKPSPSPADETKPAEIADPDNTTRQKSQPSPAPAKPGPSPAPAQPSPTPAASPAPAQQPPSFSDPSQAPDYPPPQDAPNTPTPDQPDFNRMPDEVLDFFRNPYNSVPNAHRVFDPLFQPAVIQKAPPSKATYKQE